MTYRATATPALPDRQKTAQVTRTNSSVYGKIVVPLLSFRMPHAAQFSAALANDLGEVPRLAEIARRFGGAHGLSADDVLRIQLVLDEIVINIIRHGYADVGDVSRHDIDVHLALDEKHTLTIRVEDAAREYDPTKAPNPRFDLPVTERRPGGLGVHIVKAIMDGITYRREDGRNILTMTKQLENGNGHLR